MLPLIHVSQQNLDCLAADSGETFFPGVTLDEVDRRE
jgi:hypothetical protein